ncbi:fatty-acid amide hydrolase 2-B-like [Calliphora vicina]|uniref:fatty-acid amide hydrolase 2-B-like n=1 Tax=Calliphora vicina TaxID=7373 RepID=UPI00325B2A1C
MELFLRFIQFMVKIFYFVIHALLKLALPRKKEQTIPPIRNKLLTLSLVELVQRMRLHQLKSKELVQAYIDRIREVNPHINAIIEERFEEALKDAERADDMLNKCPLDQTQSLFTRYPILGIPFTVKESCGLKGMAHVVGSLERVGQKAQYDCVPVENFRSAGGIPLLVSATPEYCFSIETNSFTNDRCLNPYDFRRTCGGSSGGEGALHGSGASIFGIGSDIAGSIRIPCLFNGVFGHKPTGGLISNLGHFPNSDDPKCLEYLQMGPITRFGRDLGMLLQVMIGRKADKLELLTPVDTKEIKVFYSFGFDGLNGLLHQPVDFDIQLSIMKAVKYFEKKGCSNERARIKHFRNSTEMGLTGIARLSNFPYLMRADNKPPQVKENIKELIKGTFGYSKYTKEALIFELMRSTNVFMPRDNMEKYEAEVKLLKQEIIDLLGWHGVLFFPTFHIPAIHHNSSVFPLWGIDYCLIFNILGLPCTHIPMGLDSNGLPIGFQVVAAPMRDKLCLQVAGELEQGFGGWVPPTKHDFK